MCKPPDIQENVYYMEYQLHDLQGSMKIFKRKSHGGDMRTLFEIFFGK